MVSPFRIGKEPVLNDLKKKYEEATAKFLEACEKIK